jgi:hypothetical protein
MLAHTPPRHQACDLPANRAKIGDDGFLDTAGYHRKHSIRLLKATPASLARLRRPRLRVYDDAVLATFLLRRTIAQDSHRNKP